MSSAAEPRTRNVGTWSSGTYEHVAAIIVTDFTLRLWLADALTPLVPVAAAPPGAPGALLCPAAALADDSGGLLPARGDSDAPGPLALADAEADCVPVTWIWWPTCLSSSAVSPFNRHVIFAPDADDDGADALALELPDVAAADGGVLAVAELPDGDGVALFSM